MAIQELKELIVDDIKKYPGDFVVLGLTFIIGIGAFVFFSYDFYLQKKVVYGLALAYFWWGVFHHWRKDSFNLRVVLEYLLMAVFGAILVIFVLLRA